MIKTIKKPVSILLAVLMVVSLFTVVPITASAASTGSWENLTWNIDDNGKLTFFGTGSIPNSGFANNQSIKEVEINSSVTSIGHWAFERCDALETVTFTANPTVGMQIFCWNEKLKSVTFAEGMTTLPEHTFTQCHDHDLEIHLPSTLTSIGYNAFCGSTIKSVNIPEGAELTAMALGDEYKATITNLIFEGGARTFKPGQFSNFEILNVQVAAGSRIAGNAPGTIQVSNSLSGWELDEAQSYLRDIAEWFSDYVSYGNSEEEALEYACEIMGVSSSWYELIPGEAYDYALTSENTNLVFSGNTNVTFTTPVTTTHTITWKNGNDVIELDENVAYGDTPSYDGETPTKDEDDDYTYTFSGWESNGTTYPAGTDLPAVTDDVTYNAAFTPVPKLYTVVGSSAAIFGIT